MDIWFYSTGSGFIESHGMFGARLDPIPDIGRKSQNQLRLRPRDRHFNSQESRVLDLYANFLDGRDENIAVGVLAQNGREEPHEGWPADRRAAVKPGPVAGNPHVDVAAKRRIPLLHRRQSRGKAFGIALCTAPCLPSKFDKKRFGHNLCPILWVYRKVLNTRFAAYTAII